MLQLHAARRRRRLAARRCCPTASRCNLLLLADTSASMDQRPARRSKPSSSRVAARVADAEGHVQPRGLRRGLRLGLREAGRRRRRSNVATAREFLADAALARLDRSRQGVRRGAWRRPSRRRTSIYIGDGIVTTGDADPRAFAKRLQQLYARQGRHVPRRRRRQQLRAGRAQGDRLARRRLGAARSAASRRRRPSPWSCSARSPSRRCAT